MEHRELLTECEVLECQFRPRREGGQDRREKPQNREYRGLEVSDPMLGKATESTRPALRRGTGQPNLLCDWAECIISYGRQDLDIAAELGGAVRETVGAAG